jgi:hypothetical protein
LWEETRIGKFLQEFSDFLLELLILLVKIANHNTFLSLELSLAAVQITGRQSLAPTQLLIVKL